MSRGEGDNYEAPTCWICLGTERRDKRLGTLRSPCACKGSVGHVHERCLQEWVLSNQKTEMLAGLPACPTCKQRYRGEVVLLLAAGSALRFQLDLPGSVQSSLVTALQNARMSREASALLRRSMKWNTLIADPTHPETMQALCNVAAAMCEIKQLEAAAVLLRRVLRSCERLLGPTSTLQFGGRRRAAFRGVARLGIGGAAGGGGGGQLLGEVVEEELLALEEFELAQVVAVGQGAAEALAEVLRKQGRSEEEADRQLQRGRTLADRGRRVGVSPLLCMAAIIAVTACHSMRAGLVGVAIAVLGAVAVGARTPSDSAAAVAAAATALAVAAAVAVVAPVVSHWRA